MIYIDDFQRNAMQNLVLIKSEASLSTFDSIKKFSFLKSQLEFYNHKVEKFIDKYKDKITFRENDEMSLKIWTRRYHLILEPNYKKMKEEALFLIAEGAKLKKEFEDFSVPV